jgi:hypothetical protein
LGVINLADVLLGAAGPSGNHAFFGFGRFVFFLLVRFSGLSKTRPRHTLEGLSVIVLA